MDGQTNKKRERDWRLHCSPYVQACSQCGHSIERWADCYFDMTSGHLVRHVECHRKAGA